MGRTTDGQDDTPGERLGAVGGGVGVPETGTAAQTDDAGEARRQEVTQPLGTPDAPEFLPGRHGGTHVATPCRRRPFPAARPSGKAGTSSPRRAGVRRSLALASA